MPEIQWYYARNEQQFGPVLGSELKQLAASGGLARDDLVWREGMEQWAPAGRIKGLFPESKETPTSGPAIATMDHVLPPAPPEAPPPPSGAAIAAPPPSEPRPASIGQRYSAESVLTMVQASLWGMCVLVVLLGGVLFLIAILRAGSDNQQAGAAGAVYMTFFIGAYVIARAGEKVSQLMAAYLQRTKRETRRESGDRSV